MVALIILGIVLGLLGIVMFSTYVKKIWRKDEFHYGPNTKTECLKSVIDTIEIK
jgi:hypothetical protein